MTFLTYLISGLALGSVYAIIALGYTMVYGIAKMLNFAHGDIIMVGGYAAFFAFNKFGLSPILSILASVIVCTILGVIIERLAYKPLRQASSLSVQLLLTKRSAIAVWFGYEDLSGNADGWFVETVWRQTDDLLSDFDHDRDLSFDHGRFDIVH